jgi:hypothetical protein
MVTDGVDALQSTLSRLRCARLAPADSHLSLLNEGQSAADESDSYSTHVNCYQLVKWVASGQHVGFLISSAGESRGIVGASMKETNDPFLPRKTTLDDR